MDIFSRIRNKLLYPGSYLFLSLKARLNWLKSLMKRQKIVFETPYKGQKILLLALYEKGLLRNDIKNLLETAKAQGAYTLCVNTLKLANPDEYKNLMDFYIERYNYGRDFGSYKAGFLQIYEQQWHDQCPRLLMLNDSLFYSKKKLDNFLATLFNTDIEALGATENHEIEHHLGSFCISIAGSVIRRDKFQTYWKKYTNSDIRPVVIKRGEMMLSKTLRRCVSSSDNFSALFDVSWFSNYLNENPKFLENIANFCRSSDLVDWKRPTMKSALECLINKYIAIDPAFANIEANIDTNIGEAISYFVDSPSGLKKLVMSSVKEIDGSVIERRVYEEVKNNVLECFSSGSQIHQNGILLHQLGLPIIKLDGLFRGMFSTEDVEKLSQQLESDETPLFKRMMYSKPFGGDSLFGWKRAAFYHGLI